jgi:mono/diheme cytochrome c family protein
MRYFLAAWVLVLIAVVSVAGLRGSISRKPPLYVFPDMDRQPKLRPQEPNTFFPDGRSSRQPVPGTIARSHPYELPVTDPKLEAFPFEDAPANTGRIAGTTNFVENGPFQITAQFMARGQQRYQIYCSPCHGPLADGNGITKKLGMAVVANLHDQRIVAMPDGEIFSVITHGKNLMGSYASQIAVEDRWAVIAYLRALQISRLGSTNDVPAQMRSSLK